MLNKFGIWIKECCASCDARGITTKGTCRMCLLDNKEVDGTDTCSSWQLRSGLEEAGSAKGGVKRKAYIDYLQEVRDREATARNLGLRIPAKTLEEVRAEYETKCGSIYYIKD